MKTCRWYQFRLTTLLAITLLNSLILWANLKPLSAQEGEGCESPAIAHYQGWPVSIHSPHHWYVKPQPQPQQFG
jgi:hypothetical protein